MKRSVQFASTLLASSAVSFALAGSAVAGVDDKKLDIYWVDVEGGAATLFVTPAGETVLIDTGNPGDRDADRVKRAVTEAGLKKIDHLVVTHYHSDHYGGLADIAARVPIGVLYTRDLAGAPEKERTDPKIEMLKEVKVEKRVRIKPGAKLPLKQTKGTAPLAFTFIGADEKFIASRGAGPNPEICKEHVARPPDASDNKNSVVMLVSFGPWRFFDGGDLTWNTEAALVCPKNLVGKPIDVFQINHHGLDQSNNPVLVKSLAPTVAVVNNGPKKGGDKGSFATLKATPSIKDIYQVHRNVRTTPEQNTVANLIANPDENCVGNHIKLSVEPDGKRYGLAVPATKHEASYETK
ncbi:MAG TPA: MBL fold metallo-hydrolase, partial [Polyangia bacterium]